MVKKGAASFYIVAFTTLILIVISLSFATVVLSLTERSSQNDLSQSAYDSAMAGVEDAQLLILEYQKCLAGTRTDNCSKIISVVEGTNNDCMGMADALNRVVSDGGVMIQESNSGNSQMQQYYTCVLVNSILGDSQHTIPGSGHSEVYNISLADPNQIDYIDEIKVTWGGGQDATGNVGYSLSGGNVVFPNNSPMPPAISIALVQAGDNFSIDDFKKVVNNQTNLGMVFLVPTTGSDATNEISADAFLKSNNKSVENKPYQVKCPEGSCEVTIGIPMAIGGSRSSDNFFFVITNYGNNGLSGPISPTLSVRNAEAARSGAGDQGVIKQKSQIEVDSTGRANDLYRRVVARFEYGADSSFVRLLGPLELFGDSDTLKKTLTTVCEYNEFDNIKPTCGL